MGPQQLLAWLVLHAALAKLIAAVGPCFPAVCYNDCPQGRELDAYGCQTCQCQTVCPDILCRQNCPNGRLRDQRGCEICKCREVSPHQEPSPSRHLGHSSSQYPTPNQHYSCQTLHCRAHCPHGRMLDAYGCETCECKQATVCQPVPCNNICLYGRVLLPDGCESCLCKTTPPPYHQCRPITCGTYCPRGRIRDANNCETCHCVGGEEYPSFCGPPCPVYCPTGFKIEDNGCPRCDCRESACPPRQCPHQQCPQGFLRDKDGCIVCVCRTYNPFMPYSGYHNPAPSYPNYNGYYYR